MKRIICVTLCLVFLCGTFCGAMAASASGEKTIEVQLPVKYRQSEARKIFDMINRFRTGSDAWYWNESNSEKIRVNNLQALTYDYELEQVAMQRAAELVLQYAHTRPDQSRCFSAYPEKLYAAGENIAYGFTTAEKVHAAWLEEDELYANQGHRRNMLSRDFTAVGLGCVEYNGKLYWAEAFFNPLSNRAKTEALDGEKTVSVEVATDALQVFELTSSCNSIELQTGNRTDLPTVQLRLQMQDSHNLITLTQPVTWESSSAATAKVESGSLVALQTGDCVLRASAYGKTIEIPITVTGVEPEPVSEPVSEPDTDPAEPTQPTTDPVAEPTTEPVSEPVSEPVADPTTPTEPSTEPSTEPTTEPTTEPVAHVHQSKILPPVTPTCLSTGLTAGEVCSVCGEVLQAQKVIPKTAHSFQTKTKAAKYHKAGVITQTCSVCGLCTKKTIAAVQTITLSEKSYTYDRSRHTPKITILDQNGTRLRRNTDYRLTYPSGRKKVGTYAIEITFIGNYAGSKTVKYKILPGTVTKLKAKTGTQSTTISWSAAPGATHYVVFCSTKQKSGYKELGRTTKTKAKILKLKSNKTYYFRVRPITVREEQQWKGPLTNPIKVVAK